MEASGSPKLVTARTLQVDSDAADQRIDNFLFRLLKGVPKGLVYRILRTGQVRVNSGRVRPTYRLQIGDQVRVPPLHQSATTPHSADLVPDWLRERLLASVLYEDDRVIALNKPSGLAVHGGSSVSMGLIEAVRSLRPNLSFLELGHRLDQETSGCLLLAKRRDALTQIHTALRDRTSRKCYLALVVGRWPESLQRIDAPLAKRVRGGERLIQVEADGQTATTLFSIERRSADYTLLMAQPITGRTHQIRVHAANAGYPIAGDRRYGDKASKLPGLNRLFLHAVEFTLELDGAPLTLTAPLPEELQQLLESLNLK